MNAAIPWNIGVYQFFNFDAGCRNTVLHPGYSKKKGQDERNYPALALLLEHYFKYVNFYIYWPQRLKRERKDRVSQPAPIQIASADSLLPYSFYLRP